MTSVRVLLLLGVGMITSLGIHQPASFVANLIDFWSKNKGSHDSVVKRLVIVFINSWNHSWIYRMPDGMSEMSSVQNTELLHLNLKDICKYSTSASSKYKNWHKFTAAFMYSSINTTCIKKCYKLFVYLVHLQKFTITGKVKFLVGKNS